MDLQQAEDLYQQAFAAYKNNELELAIQLWNQIEKSSDEVKEIYAKAKLFLGILLEKQEDLIAAAEAYKNVSRKDSAELYAWSQWKLCSLTRDDIYLKNIVLEDDVEMYAKARFILGLAEADLRSKYQYWKEIPEHSHQYEQEIYQITMLSRIVRLDKSVCKDKLFQLFQIVSKILQGLFIQSEYEQSIAHYTNLTVAKLLLSKKNDKSKNFKPKSKLRLNTINLMNDPEEGVLINKLLGLDAKITTQDSAFITCFTLHHDSLNQFRLYGKQDKEEASGLSLILDQTFFDLEHNTARIYEKKILLNKGNEKSHTIKNSLATMPLYRCIYLDPTSGLIKVAQREEWSFHREFKQENKTSILDSNPEAESYWKEYQAEILEIESQVTTYLKQLVEQVKLLNPKSLNDEEKELLAEILLPLRYLIKHMAFKEEQECRMIYVTQMDNPLIKYDEKINRIYIDYEPSVMKHLEKIYLAPKAKGEKMVFEYLCSRGQAVRKGKAPVKVKISQNPFQ